MAQWEAYAAAGDLRFGCNIVALMHRLADGTLNGASRLICELLASEPVYLDLGLEPQGAIVIAEGMDSVAAEVDGYFPPKARYLIAHEKKYPRQSPAAGQRTG